MATYPCGIGALQSREKPCCIGVTQAHNHYAYATMCTM